MTSFSALRLHETDTSPTPDCRIDTLTLEQLSAGDVIIRIAYSSLNYKDALAYAGRGKIIRSFPRITGIDFVGHVESSHDARFQAGDQVIVHGFGVGVEHDGGHAQYARVPADWVMKLPENMSLLDACSIGAAGYTAALSLHWMEQCGLTPEQGDIAITGATGGVASLAIDILSHRGYQVCAITSKTTLTDYLMSLGAKQVQTVPDLSANRPLRSAQWAGAIDSVGGDILPWLLSTTQAEGVVTSFGNAAGSDLSTTVFPFILRGVKLLGINANSPLSLREQVWHKLHTIYSPSKLHEIRHIISLADLPSTMEAMLARETHGRFIVDMTL